jgi:N-methylhydantoinase A
LSWVVTVSAPAQGELGPSMPMQASQPKPRARRPVFDPQTGEFHDVPIYWRDELGPGAKISGPAVIAENDTSTVISALFEAKIDRFGYIALTRRQV